MTARDNYTFGDNDRASARLRRLAELYEHETRELLQRHGRRAPRLAVDLGCGPGWSTRLLHEALAPLRTLGLDASERFVVEARRSHGPELLFVVHDVTRELHLANLRTWREEEYVRKNYDPCELERIEPSLERIARGVEDGGRVWNAVRQIAAERRLVP